MEEAAAHPGSEVLGRSSAFVPGAIDQRAILAAGNRARSSYDGPAAAAAAAAAAVSTPYAPTAAELDPLEVTRRINSVPAFGVAGGNELLTTAALLQAQVQAQAQVAAASLGIYQPEALADPLTNLVSQNTMLQAALLQAELNRAMVLGLSLTAAQPSGGSLTQQQQQRPNHLFKTELCRSWEDTGICRYGTKCQFAHGQAELRPVLRHPKYKTELCRTFLQTGNCPYGNRCRFVHASSAAEAVKKGLVGASETSMGANRLGGGLGGAGGVRRMVSESHAQGRVSGGMNHPPSKLAAVPSVASNVEAMETAKREGLADLKALTAAIEELEAETGHKVDMSVELHSPTAGSPRDAAEGKF